MLKKGVKEVRDHFTQYLKKVKRGEKVIVTERGRPVVLLSPIPEVSGVQERIELAAMRGLIRLPQKEGKISSLKRKIKLTGKSLTEIILEDRETRW